MPHEITLTEREQLIVTGVSEVLHFEETGVVLSATLGVLTVQGRDLKLRRLSPEGGRVSVEGQITALSYEEPRARGLLGRLLG